MIPKFPEFKKIEISDENEIKKITSKFLPYSDFNFTNLWAWNFYDRISVSKLNKNLVVFFDGYVSGTDRFFSFLGKKKINDTAKKILEYSEEKYGLDSLKLVPEFIAVRLSKKKFKIHADRDSFDYIFSVNSLAKMDEWGQNTSAKNIRRIIKENLNYEIVHRKLDNNCEELCKNVFAIWAKIKGSEDLYGLDEYKAFERTLSVKKGKLNVILLYLDKKVVGFSIYEKASKKYAISHFFKINKGAGVGFGDFLNWSEAEILKKQKIKYYNWEQDLGIAGLRSSKEKYKPEFFLKKFNVKKD